MKYILPLAVLVILISSCRKAKFDEDYVCLEDCIVFAGRVLDTPYNNKLAGVELRFYFHSLEGSSFLRPPVYLGTKKTGQDGSYQFAFGADDFKESGYFSIMGIKEGYFLFAPDAGSLESYGTILSKGIKLDSTYVYNTKLYKKAELELKIKSERDLDFETFEIRYGTDKTIPGVLGGYNGYVTGFNIIFDKRIDRVFNLNIPVGIKSYINWQGYNYLEPFKLDKVDSLISNQGEKVFYEIVL